MRQIIFIAALTGLIAQAGAAPETITTAPSRLQKIGPNRLQLPEHAPQRAFIQLETARTQAEPLLEPLPARISYDENRTVRLSTPLAGRITGPLAQPGNKVRAGQVLATVESPDYANLQAEATKAQADLQVRQQAWQRTQQLYQAGVVAQKEAELSKSEYTQAISEVARTRLRLKHVAPAGEGRFALRSPIAGVIAERHLNPGQEIRPEQEAPLFVITDPTQLWLHLDVPEQLIGRLHGGQNLAVKVDAYPQDVFQATVQSIGVALDPVTRKIQVRASLPNPDGRLKVDMFGRATPLAGQERQVVTLPNSAFITTGIKHFIFVEESPGQLVKREVKLGLRGHDNSVVLSGVQAGERVLVRGALLLDSELGGQ